MIGWATWTGLILVLNGAAFVLAVGVPIFPYLVGIAASLFASCSIKKSISVARRYVLSERLGKDWVSATQSY